MSRDDKSESRIQQKKRHAGLKRLYTPKRARSVTETPEAREKRMQTQRNFGERIRKLRFANGFAQEAFADVCGIHRSHMGEIERGETNLTLQTMITLAQEFKLTLHELFKGIA